MGSTGLSLETECKAGLWKKFLVVWVRVQVDLMNCDDYFAVPKNRRFVIRGWWKVKSKAMGRKSMSVFSAMNGVKEPPVVV
jgi:hypothetical protein